MKNKFNVKYPIGVFKNPSVITIQMIKKAIDTIKTFPFELEKTIDTLAKENLKKRYRKNGWNGYQIIHHCADSHINGYIRFKAALTESSPIIKPYKEEKWAMLEDAKSNEIYASILLIKGLHYRWGILLENVPDNQWNLHYIHPDNNTKITLQSAICLYAWHCKHHIAHLKLLKNE